MSNNREWIAISSLENSTKNDTRYCVIVKNKTIPSIYDDKNRLVFNGLKLVYDKMLIISIFDYSGDKRYVKYISEDGFILAAYFPSNLQISLLDNDEKEKFEEIYLAAKIKDLISNLAYNSKIGSSPEIFVEDENGNCIPAFLFQPGKDKPAKTNQTGMYGQKPMYWSGFQSKFKTSGQDCLAWQIDSIAAGMHAVYAAALAKFPKAKLSVKSVFDIPSEIILAADDNHVAFDIKPCLNAYGLEIKIPSPRETTFRAASGSIHFELNEVLKKKAMPIVKSLDAILGVACVSLFKSFDDCRRRTLCGLPGEYTMQPHGIEYRALSNAWLIHPMISNLVFDLSRKAAMFGANGLATIYKASEEEVIHCMMDQDVTQAHVIMDKNKDLFLKLFRAAYNWSSTEDQTFLYNIFYNGLESVIKDPYDFVTNWNLKETWKPHSDGTNRNVNKSYKDLMREDGFKIS